MLIKGNNLVFIIILLEVLRFLNFLSLLIGEEKNSLFLFLGLLVIVRIFGFVVFVIYVKSAGLGKVFLGF